MKLENVTLHIVSLVATVQLYCDCFQQGKVSQLGILLTPLKLLVGISHFTSLVLLSSNSMQLCSVECQCRNCKNTEAHNGPGGIRTLAVAEILKRRPDAFEPRTRDLDQGCNCKKNRCLKSEYTIVNPFSPSFCLYSSLTEFTTIYSVPILSSKRVLREYQYV